MRVWEWSGFVLFGLSLIANGVLILRLRKVLKTPQKSLELQEFLADLMSGEGLVRIKRVDPMDVLLRSPGRYGA